MLFISSVIIFYIKKKGGFNLFTNFFYGETCKPKNSETNVEVDGEEEVTSCQSNWITMLSIGNKKDN